MKKKRQFTYILWKEGVYYIAQCLNIEVSSFGKTRKEALANLEEALELYLEDSSNKTFSEVKSPRIGMRTFQHA